MDVHFSCCDYRDWDKLFDDGKLVNYVIYCDIPYENTTQYGFNINFNYKEFWDMMRKWSTKNIVLISEFNAPDDFECIWSKEVINQINLSNKENRDSEKITSVEKLFKYKQ
jgi:DNA adenine methylase